MPESRPPIELQGLSLAELQKLIDERRLPPVDQWNPERCGHSGMRIARDGTWYHEGSADPPAGDGAAVLDRAAARARRPPRAGDAGREARHRGRGDRLPRGRDEQRGRSASSAASPSRSTAATRSSSAPSIRCGWSTTSTVPRRASLVRHGLEAELARPVYYELAEIALAEGHDPPGVWSGGAFFPLETHAG